MKKAQFTKAFTLIELLVVISIISVLMAILMPTLRRVREQAREVACRQNLHQYGLAVMMYINDNDGRFPLPGGCLTGDDGVPSNYPSYCRWHDPRYPARGTLWRYISNDKVNLCPTFKVLAKSAGMSHPNHDKTIPVTPYFGYSMNGLLGNSKVDKDKGAPKLAHVTRGQSEVFLFSEENMWPRGGDESVLNDQALMPNGRDWFGTFHRTSTDDRNRNFGTANAVFVDGHAQEVRSAFKDNPKETSNMEYGRFEKYGWPHKTPPFTP
jgi:prepilin-type N-terminal cleavage/methylation domain-containing protein/prepilin-type processing-associated H-X9-DG protein